MDYILKHTGDKVGIVGSVLCLIHCLAAPFVAITGTALADHWHAGDGVFSLDHLFIIVNGFAVYFATKHVAAKIVKWILWFAFALFATSLLLESKGEIFHWLSYVASFLLIGGHLFNIYTCRASKGSACKVS